MYMKQREVRASEAMGIEGRPRLRPVKCEAVEESQNRLAAARYFERRNGGLSGEMGEIPNSSGSTLAVITVRKG